ncbi:hypothetical protein OG897_30235 [Streptomyces sp. NBC_00237]|uniref:hypothetical protein n=1 Tax=Streptomyces sp. NBC_00237 TaxID=2975687 RepID=UPI00225C0081|nr:hypothetical protein [Streptomyces sp. NBC_00237]MCX5205718.1 hypothetical protein [Streptomyces sp. NBC_00237]
MRTQLEHGTDSSASAVRGELTWQFSDSSAKTQKGASAEIRVDLHTTAFTGMFTDTAAPLRTLGMNPSAEIAPGSIIPVDQGRVVKAFGDVFLNPLQWPSLSNRFVKDPVGFYQDYLRMFFPAVTTFTVPLTATSASGAALALQGSGVPHMLFRDSDAKEFPPRQGNFAPVQPLVLGTGSDAVTLRAMTSTVIHQAK